MSKCCGDAEENAEEKVSQMREGIRQQENNQLKNDGDCCGKDAGRDGSPKKHRCACGCGGKGKRHGVRTENTPKDVPDDFSDGRLQLGLQGK